MANHAVPEVVRPATLQSRHAWETLPRLLDDALGAIADRGDRQSRERYDALVKAEIPGVIRSALPESYVVNGRTSTGTDADVPWIGVFPAGDGSAKSGVYVAYLFAFDGSHFYLSLNQGTENVKGGNAALDKRVLDIRSIIGDQPDLTDNIDLRSKNTRPQRYEHGSAYAVAYQAGEIPASDVLRGDLERFLEMLAAVDTAGLKLSPSLEPIHLVLKWNADRGPTTIVAHREVAENKGSVWWGKFGAPGTRGVSTTRLQSLRDQLAQGHATYCFLYRRGEVWRTALEEITDSPDDVDSERLPGYYTTEDCANLFLRISNFEQLEADWPSGHLVMATNPDPNAFPGALSNQTTPLFVYQRFTSPPAPAPAETEENQGMQATPTVPSETPTFDWLRAETLWQDTALEEVLEALTERGQLVLAGPPGTGKTWVAKALARYVCRDEALAWQVLQFHPTYGYEEFIEGLRPVTHSGTISFERVDGAVLRAVNLIEEQAELPHVLVLDEMNRANLPRVFGELLYLLEYRTDAADLLYTQSFSLPANLWFIGTMNTADRSIRSIDIALRRRFEIFECFPDRAILESYYHTHGVANDVPDLVEGFDSLNQKLTELLDRHHTIGHTFFMHPAMTTRRLRATWRRQLKPLLEEYFFDQPDLVETFALESLWPSTTND